MIGNMIAVCGVKNSGKTTLIRNLIRCLTARGHRVAYIKHDGHDFTCDVENTDSHRAVEAGAYGAAVFSGARIFVHKKGTGEDERFLAGLFPEADVILLEGMKDSAYPKIEVIRKEISGAPVSNPEGRFLLVTDHPAERFSEPVCPFEETDMISDAVLSAAGYHPASEN